jgi:galactokinase/mevalonate kinase-like predicted kinase
MPIFIAVQRLILTVPTQRKASDDDELDHQLTSSVQRRLQKLLQGKSVSPIHSVGEGPSFVGVGSSSAAALSAPLSQTLKPKSYDEPDQEAIEIKLDADDADDNYVQLAA